jgi:hypothetical protein
MMGHNETTVAGSALRRTILALLVAVLMAATMALNAMPAFAAKPEFAEHPGEKDFAGPSLGQNIGVDCNRVITGGCSATPNTPFRR